MTQVVPFYHSSATGVIHYRDMLSKYFPEARPGFVSLEGFIAAQCLVSGLRKVEGNLTTENLIDALDSIRDLDLRIGPIIISVHRGIRLRIGGYDPRWCCQLSPTRSRPPLRGEADSTVRRHRLGDVH